MANRVSYVAFTDDVYWNETVNYYNDKYGNGGTYENNGAENPCRGLPYFVPIHNENLFGTATFEYPDAGNSNATASRVQSNIKINPRFFKTASLPATSKVR